MALIYLREFVAHWCSYGDAEIARRSAHLAVLAARKRRAERVAMRGRQ